MWSMSKFVGYRDNDNAAVRMWFILVCISLIVTLLVVFGIHAIFDSYQVGVVISTVIWAAIMGWALLTIFSPKLVATLFGGLLGSGASQVSVDNGLMTLAQNVLGSFAGQLADIFETPEASAGFLQSIVWLFVVLVTLFCVPALSGSEGRSSTCTSGTSAGGSLTSWKSSPTRGTWTC